MIKLTRFLEWLSGEPHQQRNAAMVSRSIDGLLASAGRLAERLKNFDHHEGEQPLDVLIKDISEQRASQGGGDALKSKLFP